MNRFSSGFFAVFITFTVFFLFSTIASPPNQCSQGWTAALLNLFSTAFSEVVFISFFTVCWAVSLVAVLISMRKLAATALTAIGMTVIALIIGSTSCGNYWSYESDAGATTEPSSDPAAAATPSVSPNPTPSPVSYRPVSRPAGSI